MFSCEIFKNTYNASVNGCFCFSESSISFFFYVWQILSASISPDYKVGIFLKVTTLFDQMQPYQLCIN